MSYTIIVFVKQVPDTQNISGDAMKPDGTVNRQALPAIFNPEDLNALELALQLKDRYGAKVVAATMGPPNAAEVLRDALCRGADEAVLQLKSLEAFAKAADGQSTKIIIPSDLQGIASLATTFKEVASK